MKSPVSADSHVVFLVAGTSYALRSEDVRHMEMIEQITPVPNAAAYLEGVVFSRGQIVPVLNLRARFGFERAPHTLQSRLVVVQSDERWIALVVDSAREFVSIPASAIEPPSHAITGPGAHYLTGIATINGRLILVLDIGNVLQTSDVSPAVAGTKGHLAGAPVMRTETRTIASGGQ
jgi:purine-binding chemotaxis protein CheW